LNIIISGYGRMGRMVESIAASRGHEVSYILDNDEDWKKLKDGIKGTVIDFSFPETAAENILRSFDLGLPVVCGTTGWYDKLEDMKEECHKRRGASVVAANFSIGVNILFMLNKKLAESMDRQPQYTPMISETHHIHKKDAPSGTALTLGMDLIGEIRRIKSWSDKEIHEEDEIFIQSIREGEVAGIHEVIYTSPFDTLSIRHEAADRRGFATGAVIAAEWLQGKEGFYSMQDVLGI
jgi:4-hydroxy-tetrahydrodipicolinate reductase